MIWILLIGSLLAQSPLGKTKFYQGEISSLAYLKVKAKAQSFKGKSVLENTSYLIGDNGQMVIELFDGTLCRFNKNTKFYLKKDKHNNPVIHLVTGAIRALYSPKTHFGRSQFLTIKLPNAVVKVSEAKFSLIYDPLFEETSLYVEKGSAEIARNNELNTNKLGISSGLKVEAMEQTSINNRFPGNQPILTLSDEDSTRLKKYFLEKPALEQKIAN